ncbi:MAG: ArnT family glycosyltransferase [Vicinamibacterales bacterium]
MRLALRIAALTVAGAALLWAAAIALSGGFEFSLLGLRITNHDTVRPLVWAAAALSLFAYLHGLEPTCDALRAAASHVPAWVAATLLAGSVLVAGVLFATTVASGADAYGYVSQADLWIHGRLMLAQAWPAELPWSNAPAVFAPLGYAAAPAGNLIVPTYSPGLPLLMAAAKIVGGQEALFWVVPVCGSVLVLATYGIGRRVADAPSVALGAAWLMATSPVFWFMVVLPMSDVPTAAAWALAWYFALARRPSGRTLLSAGMCAALAVAIRPNLVPLAVPLAWTCATNGQAGRGETGHRFRSWRHLAIFGVGLLPGPLLVAVVNRRLYGSALQSGYGNLDQLFAIENIWPNLKTYLTWLLETETPLALMGLAALGLAAARVRRSTGGIGPALGAALFVVGLWAIYLPYLQFDEWPFLRFLLPSFPLMFVGVAQAIRRASRLTGPIGVLAAAWLVLAAGTHRLDIARQRGAFDELRHERDAVELARHVGSATSERSVVFSLIHSGSLRYYGGRVTARYDQMPSDALDTAASWLADHGVRTYALLEPWEVPQFRERFDGQRALERLDEQPALEYAGEHVVRLFDLTPAVTARTPASSPQRVERTPRGLGWLRSAPAVASPALPSPALAPSADSSTAPGRSAAFSLDGR